MEVTRDVDQESEAERIMEHYRHPTIVSPDVAGTLSRFSHWALDTNSGSVATTPETQAAFAELQEELHDFLSQYIPKVVALGNIAGGELAAAAQEAEDGNPLKRTRTGKSSWLQAVPLLILEPSVLHHPARHESCAWTR